MKTTVLVLLFTSFRMA